MAARLVKGMSKTEHATAVSRVIRDRMRMDISSLLKPRESGLKIVTRFDPLTRPIFCTKANERVYITAKGCEIGFGGTSEL
jgi:hypothetical protein